MTKGYRNHNNSIKISNSHSTNSTTWIRISTASKRSERPTGSTMISQNRWEGIKGKRLKDLDSMSNSQGITTTKIENKITIISKVQILCWLIFFFGIMAFTSITGLIFGSKPAPGTETKNVNYGRTHATNFK